jgi:hypothetical protein
MPHANALVIAGKIPGAWLVHIKDAGHAVMNQLLQADSIIRYLQTGVFDNLVSSCWLF